MMTVSRGGRYHRVADPAWINPLDPSHAERRGGRWNPPESFPTLYLCRSLPVARANVNRLLAAEPYSPEDLRPEAAPLLIDVELAATERLDVVSDDGCEAVGLSSRFPRTASGKPVGRLACQRIGMHAWEDGLHGVAARSAWASGEELAHFAREGASGPGATGRRAFEDWFWPR